MSRRIQYFLFLLIIQLHFGQENNWTLQKCIDVGIENSIAIKIQQLEVKRTQKARVSIANELLPNINLFGSQSYNFGSTIDPSTNGRVSSNIQYDNFFLNAQMSVLDFGAIANSQKSKIAIDIAKAEQAIIENEYKLQILESYFQTLFTQELVKIQEQQLKNTKFNLDRISKEVEIGSKPKSDLYDIQFAFVQDEKRTLETNQLFEIQKKQLFQLINYSDIDIEKIRLEVTLSISQSNLSELSNPKIKASVLALESSKKELNFQRARNLPTLTTFYQLSSFYYKPLNQPDVVVDNFSNQIANNKNQQVGLQLSIPVFNGFKNNKSINAAKIETQKAKLNIEQENLKITQQLDIEKSNKENSIKLQEKLGEMEKLANASFITTQSKFTSGIVDAFSFSAAKNNLLNTQYDVLKNKLQLQFTILKMNLIYANSL